MNNWKLNLAILMAGLFGMAPAMADFDGSDTLVCSLGEILECDHGTKCRHVSNESIDAPDFVRFNFKKMEYNGIAGGEDRGSDKIDTVTEIGAHLMVQGSQGTSAEARDAFGWSASIDQSSGRMTLTGSGDNAGFVVFGACLAD